MANRPLALASVLVALLAGIAAPHAQVFSLQPKTLDEVEAAQQAAKEAAEFEHLGTLARLCLLPPSRSEDLSDKVPPYVADPTKAPARATWYGDPAKVFDNFYFIGGKVHSSWALKTSEGLIVFDTIYPYNSEELVIGGLQKLGLDPKDIKYLIISHAHQDHTGGVDRWKEEGTEVIAQANEQEFLDYETRLQPLFAHRNAAQFSRLFGLSPYQFARSVEALPPHPGEVVFLQDTAPPPP